MVKHVHSNDERVIVQLSDGTMLFIGDKTMSMKCMPDRRRTEVKRFDYDDMVILNDALKQICPNIREIGDGVGNNVVSDPTIFVVWRQLKPASDESQWRRECPFCDGGILLVGRNQESMVLSQIDGCISCGRTVLYSDIGKMRTLERTGVYE